MIQRKLVLEDGPVVHRMAVPSEDFSNLRLEGRDRFIPGRELLGRSVRYQRL
jgi:hypothetical protein